MSNPSSINVGDRVVIRGRILDQTPSENQNPDSSLTLDLGTSPVEIVGTVHEMSSEEIVSILFEQSLSEKISISRGSVIYLRDFEDITVEPSPRQ